MDNKIEHRIWDIETKESPIIEVPQQGIDYSIVNKYPNGTNITVNTYNGKVLPYKIFNNKIYNEQGDEI